jgi:hypothetical protein
MSMLCFKNVLAIVNMMTAPHLLCHNLVPYLPKDDGGNSNGHKNSFLLTRTAIKITSI